MDSTNITYPDGYLCEHEGNACPKKLKCHRYMGYSEGMTWYSLFWELYGKECKYFVKLENSIL